MIDAMGRYRRPRNTTKESNRPSVFFIVALAVGLLVLALGFWQFTRNPPAPPPVPQQTTEVLLAPLRGSAGVPPADAAAFRAAALVA